MSNKKLLSSAFLTVIFLCCSFAACAQSSIPANWKTYSDATFSFRYPPDLILKLKNDQIELSHKVRFRHTDPCDANDKPQKLNQLEDFNVIFTVEKPSVNAETNEVTREGWETTSEGSIDTGNLQGNVMLNTAEGCGQYVYSFPAKSGKNLKIERLQISLFNPTSFQYGDNKRALKMKNVIKPEQEKRLFKTIIESIKFK